MKVAFGVQGIGAPARVSPERCCLSHTLTPVKGIRMNSLIEKLRNDQIDFDLLRSNVPRAVIVPDQIMSRYPGFKYFLIDGVSISGSRENIVHGIASVCEFVPGYSTKWAALSDSIDSLSYDEECDVVLIFSNYSSFVAGTPADEVRVFLDVLDEVAERAVEEPNFPATLSVLC